MQQQPLPPASSNKVVVEELEDAVTTPVKADPARFYRGWYPRWWLLSAVFCSAVVALGLLADYALCKQARRDIFLCEISTWTDWRQYILVAVIWLLFLFGWLVAYIFGVGPIEIERQRTPFIQIFRNISQFSTVYILLLAYGGLALCNIIIVTWYLDLFQPMAYALSSIIVFVANCCFLYRYSPVKRQTYLVGYGLLALMGIGIMFLIGPFQPAIFVTELIVIVVGIISVFRRPLQAVPKTQDQAILAAMSKSISPLEVLFSLLRVIPGSHSQGSQQPGPGKAKRTPSSP